MLIASNLHDWVAKTNQRLRFIFIYSRDKDTRSSVLPGQNKRIAPLSVFHGCRKRRLKDTLTPEIAIRRRRAFPVTPALFLIAK
jgi:hypothetical protein